MLRVVRMIVAKKQIHLGRLAFRAPQNQPTILAIYRTENEQRLTAPVAM